MFVCFVGFSVKFRVENILNGINNYRFERIVFGFFGSRSFRFFNYSFMGCLLGKGYSNFGFSYFIFNF